jgi:hypothetical protein
MKPLIISCCNSPENNTHEKTLNFMRTLDENEWNYKIVGRGEIWKGFRTRMEIYLRSLSELDPTDIVVLSDARDVFCLRNPITFIKDFKKYNKKIICSMEIYAEGSNTYNPIRGPTGDSNDKYRQVHWIENYWKMYNINHSELDRKFVNAGLIAGYAENLIDFFDWALKNNFTDDQKALGAYIDMKPEIIYCDLNAELLHTSGSYVCGGLQYTDVQSRDTPTLLELSGNKSYFLHVPGNLPGQLFAYNNINRLLQHHSQTKLIAVYPQYKNCILGLEFF